ncbi:MAG: methylmalonyl Co-A mutase-associated GTPase MeaB [Candidatus Dadabacteria bacterium]|nr:MAG: methylmalonyl Co-A mutase-associated GTPase MeaB [Candidatus Dadabacteria bacterium]
MNPNEKKLLEGVLSADKRSIARAITRIENNLPLSREFHSQLFKASGRAHIVGITGSPGAGKSTLVDQLALTVTASEKSVAILAVDPSSPFSGGAVLGDRVRMSRCSESNSVYIRSMATRGSLGGLSRATYDAIQVLDAAGFDLILVETVGVGQAEVDIVSTADTCVVVLVPGMGDSVQAIKAGILEIADVYVVNKADHSGADLLLKDLKLLLSLSDLPDTGWKAEIIKTVATTGEGINKLVDALARHRQWLKASPAGAEKRRNILKERIISLARDNLYQNFIASRQSELDKLLDECLGGKSDPHKIVQQLLQS